MPSIETRGEIIWELLFRDWLGIGGLVVRNCFNLHQLTILGFIYLVSNFFYLNPQVFSLLLFQYFCFPLPAGGE